MQETLNFSQRIRERLENLKYFVENSSLSEEFSHLYKYEIPNSNGKIDIFLNFSDSSNIEKIKFQTNITGPELAYMDVACEFLENKNLKAYKLSLREIESFLRDNNSTAAYENGDHNLNRVFSFLPDFYSKFSIQAQISGPTSPDLEKDYAELRKQYENDGSFEEFSSMDYTQQKYAIDTILDRYIRPSLQADGGDVECVHFSENMIVIVYLGNCSSCDSSLTSTIDYIQDVFRKEFCDPSIMVVTDS